MSAFKLILCGPEQSGKTSLVTRLLNREFIEYGQPSLGASFLSWTPDFLSLKENMGNISFGIWDTVGHDRYYKLLPLYLKQADVVFYCCDYTSKFDRNNATKIYDCAKKCSPFCHFYIVVTKMDKNSTINNCVLEAKTWALEYMIEDVFYTSSLDSSGVYQSFAGMAKKLIATPINQRPGSVNFDFEYDTFGKKQRRFFNFCCTK